MGRSCCGRGSALVCPALRGSCRGAPLSLPLCLRSRRPRPRRSCRSTSSAPRCARSRSWYSTWRPPAGPRGATRSPRSARSRCAAASVLGELATLVDPGRRHAAEHHRPHRHHRPRWSRTRRRSAAVLPSLLEFLAGAVLVAHNAPFDAGFLRAACERHGQPWPRPPVRRHVAAGARRAVGRRGAQRAAGRAGPALRRRDHARPPRARPMPGPPSRCCTRCWSGSATSACRASPSCWRWPATRRRTAHPSAAAQTHAGRAAAGRARRVPVPRAARRGALRRHQRRPATPGAQLLLRRPRRRRRVRDMVALAERVDTWYAHTRWRRRCASCG